MNLHVLRYTDPAAYERDATPFLVRREAEHNLILGLAGELSRGVRESPTDPYLALAFHDEQIVGAALMTPPFNLVLSETDAPGLIESLVADLADGGWSPPGVLGPKELAQSFAESWCPPRGLGWRVTLEERIYRIERVRPPDRVPGSMRLATPDDRALLAGWLGAFGEEVLPPENRTDPESTIENWITTGSRTLHIWEAEKRPVSMAAVGGRTPNGARIGPVYTPPEERRRGYASALTAAVSQEQLTAGLKFCFLFTDLANPTSNRIYQEIGYEAVSDVDQLRFMPVT